MENNGFPIGILAVAPVNEHDAVLLPKGFEGFIESQIRMGLCLKTSFLTLDTGFDSKENRSLVKRYNLIPVMHPNRRSTKKSILIAQKFRWFRKDIYKERYKVERTFGWQDTYRKLVVSYDRLPEIRKGFRFLAYALVNFRVIF